MENMTSVAEQNATSNITVGLQDRGKQVVPETKATAQPEKVESLESLKTELTELQGKKTEADKAAQASQGEQQKREAETAEIAALRKEIEALKQVEAATVSRRKMEDVTSDFMQSTICEGFPKEFLQRVLNPSQDKAELNRQLFQVGEWVGEVVRHLDRKGTLKGVLQHEVGRASLNGAVTPSAQQGFKSHATAHENIAEGLRAQRPA